MRCGWRNWPPSTVRCPVHALEVVAKRSGGNPQFLRDLLRTAIESGGIADLPDSAEAAAMAQIDGLAPEDRAVVRRAAVFGLTFHPRMLAWFDEDADALRRRSAVWDRLHDLFEEEPDGYLRFRRSLLRDAAYEGLPYKLRRKLHGAVAARLEEELDFPEEEARDRFRCTTTRQANTVRPGNTRSLPPSAPPAFTRTFEAAGLYSRALEAGRSLPT